MIDTAKTISVGLLVLSINIILMLIKVTTGILGHSYALVADGIESAADIFTSLVTWAGFHISLKPPDANHPFGHGRFESLAGAFSGVSLIGAAALIAWHAMLEIRTPHHAPAWYTLPVLLLVVMFKEYLSRRVLALGTDLESAALKGDGWHHRSDALTSAAAALGIAIALIGGPGYETADDWAALLACGIIVFNGGRILRDSLHDVLDGSVDEGLVQDIRELAGTVPRVVTVEKCRLRKSGLAYFAEIHVHVDGNLTVREGHDIGHAVKRQLIGKRPQILDVLVHVEPT